MMLDKRLVFGEGERFLSLAVSLDRSVLEWESGSKSRDA